MKIVLEPFFEFTKKSMAEPFSTERNRSLVNKGILPYDGRGASFDKVWPVGGIKEYRSILEELKAKHPRYSEVFGDNDPELRRLYTAKMENLVTINGQEYFLANVEKSTKKVDGKITAFGPVTRNEDGEVQWDALDTTPKNFSYNEYFPQIKMSEVRKQSVIKEVNEFIDKYNSFVDKIDTKSGGNLTSLPLLLKWAEEVIEDRLTVISSQQKAKVQNADYSDVKRDVGNGYEELISGAQGGGISPQDYAILLLERKFHSVPTLEELRTEVDSQQMPFGEEINAILRDYLVKVIDWQINVRKAEEAKKLNNLSERVERRESDLQDMEGLFVEKINHVTDIPGKYNKATGYFSPETMETSKHEFSKSSDQNARELAEVHESLHAARQYIIDLPSKANKNIDEQELSVISDFVNVSKKFFAANKTSPFIKDETGTTSVNPALFGKQGSMGNALVAVVLKRLINMVDDELRRIEGSKDFGSDKFTTVQLPTSTPTSAPAQVPAPRVQAKSIKLVVKLAGGGKKEYGMTEADWKVIGKDAGWSV
jgi:hypothetical protein